MPAWPRNVEEGAAGHHSPGLQIGTLSIKLSSYFIKLSYKGDLAGGSKVLGEDRHEPAGPPGSASLTAGQPCRREQAQRPRAPGWQSVRRMGCAMTLASWHGDGEPRRRQGPLSDQLAVSCCLACTPLPGQTRHPPSVSHGLYAPSGGPSACPASQAGSQQAGHGWDCEVG